MASRAIHKKLLVLSPAAMSSTPQRTQRHRPTKRQPLKGKSSSSSSSSPLPSPWKAALKQNCIQRARQKRRDLVLRSRISTSATSSPSSFSSSSAPPSPFTLNNNQYNENDAARSLVEEELRARGVNVSSPARQSLNSTSSLNVIPENNLFSSQNMSIDEINDNDDNDEELVITEQEYFLLMKQVEEELQRDEAMLDEEIYFERQFEEHCMEEQIAHYEENFGISQHHQQDYQTLEMQQDEEEEDVTVPCPICNSAFLNYNAMNRMVLCPNYQDATTPCTFCWNNDNKLQQQQQQQNSSSNNPLFFIREQIRLAYEEHSSVCCGVLKFCMTSSPSPSVVGAATALGNHASGGDGTTTTLRAGCDTCHANVPIL